MHRHFDSTDIFDDDDLTLNTPWAKDQTDSQDEAPFKIGLNFINDDESSSPLSSMSLDLSHSEDWKNDSRSQSQSIEESTQDLSDDQVFRINNIHEKFRFMLMFENVNPELKKTVLEEMIFSSKNKSLKRPLKDKDVDFIKKVIDTHGARMVKTLEPIKMSRLLSIPESKRKFHVKKSDMEDIERKKALKALISERVRQFGLKKGLSSTPNPAKKKFEDKCHTIEQIMTQAAIQIDQQRVVKRLNQTISKERKQTQKDLKASVENYYAQMQQMHQESMKLIHQELSYRDMVVHSRNVKKIDLRKNFKNGSEDLNKILGITNLFNMMPNLGYKVEENERSLSSIDASFSKNFQRQ